MATFHNQACPLCDANAEYCWVDHSNRKYFECPQCGYFQISKRAEKLLAEKYQGRKVGYASEAKLAPENHMLVIRIPDHDARLKSADELQATHVDKSELCLDCE